MSAATSRTTVETRQRRAHDRERAALGVARARTQPRAAVTQDTWRTIEALAARLGRAPLNDEQRVAIRAALEGHDSVVVLADDERAVSCYQLAAFQLAQPTVVVSPVAAELKAQHEALSSDKLPVVVRAGRASRAGAQRGAGAHFARRRALGAAHSGSASRAGRPASTEQIGRRFVVVEEAHCASEASHEWRPSYAELGTTLRELGSPPVMAITRVATAAVRRDIRERLGLEAPVTIAIACRPREPAARDQARAR